MLFFLKSIFLLLHFPNIKHVYMRSVWRVIWLADIRFYVVWGMRFGCFCGRTHAHPL